MKSLGDNIPTECLPLFAMCEWDSFTPMKLTKKDCPNVLGQLRALANCKKDTNIVKYGLVFQDSNHDS